MKLNKCYYLDRFSGKMDRGSVKDKLLLVCGSKEGGAGGAAPWPPSNVFTSNELLNPDKNGLKLPPKAATTAAYCGNNALHYWVCLTVDFTYYRGRMHNKKMASITRPRITF